MKGNYKTSSSIYRKKHTKNQYLKQSEVIKPKTDKEIWRNFNDGVKPKTLKRQKRFLPFFNRQETTEQDSFLYRMINFLIKNRKNVLPIVSVMKEINTLVKSVNGELKHFTKETNNYIGTPAPTSSPVSFNLELGSNPHRNAFFKKLLGVGTQTDKLTVATSGGGLFG
ncbi:hypothetical protein EVAR_24442_1 [Eumeta japonica]|uniref:Uncharacterized protein n=1 Tax=Eumeta variegata TaxID=151549 RepID=A0A4C1WUN8_EUMVA|nr:hypothetical protein EVAR_24442_1 [Eumeta japonica]